MSKRRNNSRNPWSERNMSDKEDVKPSVDETKPARGMTQVSSVVDEVGFFKQESPVTNPSVSQGTTTVNPLMALEMSLENYKTDITKQTDPVNTAKSQIGFLKLLRSILNSPTQEEVNAKWNKVLSFANKNVKQGMNEYHMFKGAASWTGSVTEFNILRHLNWLIIQTANPETRKAYLRSINLEMILANLNQTERAALINFYS